MTFDHVVMDSVSNVTKLVGAAGNLFGPPPQSPAVSPTIDGSGSGGGGGTSTYPTYPLPPGHDPVATPPPPAAPPPPAPPAPGPQNGGLPGGANQAGSDYGTGTAGVSAIDEKLAAKLKEIFAANKASYDRVMAILKEIEDKQTQMGPEALNNPAGLLTFQKFLDEKLAEVQKILADAHVDTATQAQILKELGDEYRTTGPKGDEHDEAGGSGGEGGGSGGSGGDGGGTGGAGGDPAAVGGAPPAGGGDPLEDPLAGLGPLGGGMMDPLSALSPALAGLSSLPQMMSGMGGGGLPIGDLGSMLGSLGGGLAGMAKDGFNDKPADDAPKSPEDGFKDEEGKKPEEPKEEFKDDKPQPAPPTNPADPLAGDPNAKNETAPEAAAPEAGKAQPGETDLTVKAGDEVFTAPDPTTKAVMDDVINKGMGVTAAYAAHNIQLPPPGTAVTTPVDPNMMKGGELGYFDAQEPILALGNRKIWLDGQVQPLSALGSRTDFLGWTQAPGASARPTGVGAV
ncbi:DUF4226 domain-containing protein [Mycolicibacterium conceptionense]|uniref:DUF4226 domain-containing protein n=1 Tax=Mycolicibacterium conceptionense TaxID=451644 RepID=UPI0007EA42CC|nr:DUF4226 domain-containing protein [Mycolicibacterium conceptionense]